MKSFLEFLKNKSTIAALVMAILYPIIMIGSFVPGYSAFPKNIDKLSVAVINDDGEYGKDISDKIQKSLPFKKVEGLTLSEAQKDLDNRKLQMIIHFPKDFTQKLTSPDKKVKLDFYINESNPTMISSTMKQMVSQIETNLNKELSYTSTLNLLKKLNMPEDQAKTLAETIPSKLEPNIITSNNMPLGMHNQMGPMFLTMATYVSALIGASLLVTAFNERKKLIGKWKSFFHMQAATAVIALVSPIIGIGIVYLAKGYGLETYLQLWMNHGIQLFVSMQCTLIFILLFGQLGMLINMALMMMQVIGNGSVIIRDMMLLPYKIISYISPMYYSVNADYSILFGGGSISESILYLCLVGLGGLFINIAIVWFKKADTETEMATE